MEEVKFDIRNLYKQIKDEAMLELLTALAPNKDEAKAAEKIIRVFMKHGVSVETALLITKDIVEVVGTNTNEE
jgi:Xaa-Pro aminopeptidase